MPLTRPAVGMRVRYATEVVRRMMPCPPEAAGQFGRITGVERVEGDQVICRVQWDDGAERAIISSKLDQLRES